MSQEPHFPLSSDLFESNWGLIGLWNCEPTDPLWKQENTIGPRPVIAIPWTSVVIDRPTLRNEIVDPNSVVFYRAGEPYERRLVSPRGDRCVFVSPSRELISAALEEAGLSETNGGFPFAVGPAVSGVTRLQHHLSRSLYYGHSLDQIAVESSLTEIVRELIVAAGRQIRRPRSGPGASAHRAHLELVRHARTILDTSIDHPDGVSTLGIEELARLVHASPYHLCRIFKREVGMTIGQYWMRLRLRTAAERVTWASDNITNIAHTFGFSSHAHFTSSWTAEFGSPPTELRKAAFLK